MKKTNAPPLTTLEYLLNQVRKQEKQEKQTKERIMEQYVNASDYF